MILWTDGSASPNPGPGGCAVILDGEPVCLGREEDSTNIRMEGLALFAAMKYASKSLTDSQAPEFAEIRTDSEFWVNVLSKWAPTWEKNGWRKKTGQIKNLELVKAVYGAYKDSNVKLTWVKAHVGTAQNELADEWANRARRGEIPSNFSPVASPESLQYLYSSTIACPTNAFLT